MAKITEIEGIGDAYAEKLRKAGIRTVEGLLKECSTKSGRKATAERTGISESTILEWTNMADLFRVKGVATQYAELLKAAGVDTVKELRTRNAKNLHAKIHEVNSSKNLVRQVASLSQIERFIASAKELAPAITH